MPIAVGTLSTRGWARTPQEKIRELMNHYTESGVSQSIVYAGNIKSMAAQQANYAQDPDGMAAQVKNDLNELYGNIFPEGVEVDVEPSFLVDSTVRFQLNIELRVTDGGKEYDAVRFVHVVNEVEGTVDE